MHMYSYIYIHNDNDNDNNNSFFLVYHFSMLFFYSMCLF